MEKLKSKTEKGTSMTALIKSVTDERTKFTNDIKSEADLVTNKGFFQKTAMGERTDVAEKPFARSLAMTATGTVSLPIPNP